MKKTISLACILLLTISLLSAVMTVYSAFAVVNDEIYIRADGSVDPPETNISTFDNITYTFEADIFKPIIVQRNNILVNGAGYALQGNGSGNGLTLSGRNNVTIVSITIEGFANGIVLEGSSSNNVITQSNIIGHTQNGIKLVDSFENTVNRNNITSNAQYGISLNTSNGNYIYHNSFIDNLQHAGSFGGSTNIWDHGYPIGGNYWDDHDSDDVYRGISQNVTGFDGIADLAYFINEGEEDNYPLMGPFSPHIMTGLNIPVFPDPDVALIFQNVTTLGYATLTKTTSAPPLPEGFLLVGLFYDIQVTATFSGDVLIRILYDDSGMTLEEEMNLRLMQTDLVAGDVNTDGVVDIADIYIAAQAFGSYPDHPRWNSMCDLDQDMTIDILDLFLVASNYGKISQWNDITTYVDTESNVIFGIGSSFSIHGVTQYFFE